MILCSLKIELKSQCSLKNEKWIKAMLTYYMWVYWESPLLLMTALISFIKSGNQNPAFSKAAGYQHTFVSTAHVNIGQLGWQKHTVGLTDLDRRLWCLRALFTHRRQRPISSSPCIAGIQWPVLHGTDSSPSVGTACCREHQSSVWYGQTRYIVT